MNMKREGEFLVYFGVTW